MKMHEILGSASGTMELQCSRCPLLCTSILSRRNKEVALWPVNTSQDANF